MPFHNKVTCSNQQHGSITPIRDAFNLTMACDMSAVPCTITSSVATTRSLARLAAAEKDPCKAHTSVTGYCTVML